MCSHYHAPSKPEIYTQAFGVAPPADLGKHDVWPGYQAGFIRRHPHADAGDEAVPDREALTGQFGLIPHWAADTTIGRHTYNARSETVANKPSFRDAWHKAQHCIIPAQAFFEPDWRSGRAVLACIERADGQAMGIAGLWSAWKSPKGETVHSFTMLTVNADEHALMQMFHKPADEKRMVVILPQDSYGSWLTAKPEHSREFMREYGAQSLQFSLGVPAQRSLLS